LRGLVGEMQRIGAWRDPMLAFYARIGCRPQAYKKEPQPGEDAVRPKAASVPDAARVPAVREHRA
jgi:hypothetical protein